MSHFQVFKVPISSFFFLAWILNARLSPCFLPAGFFSPALVYQKGVSVLLLPGQSSISDSDPGALTLQFLLMVPGFIHHSPRLLAATHGCELWQRLRWADPRWGCGESKRDVARRQQRAGPVQAHTPHESLKWHQQEDDSLYFEPLWLWLSPVYRLKHKPPLLHKGHRAALRKLSVALLIPTHTQEVSPGAARLQEPSPHVFGPCQQCSWPGPHGSETLPLRSAGGGS